MSPCRSTTILYPPRSLAYFASVLSRHSENADLKQKLDEWIVRFEDIPGVRIVDPGPTPKELNNSLCDLLIEITDVLEAARAEGHM